MNRVIVHDKRRVFDGFFRIDEAVLSYEGPEGRMIGPVRRLSLERGDSVAAVVFQRDRRCILLASQFRYPTHDTGPGWLTEIPAGMIDAGESPEQAVRREVREESGYDIERLDSIATFYLSPGGSSERIILYYAEVSDASRVGAGGGQGAEGESIRLVEAPVAEVVREVKAGRIADAKTLVGLLWLMTSRSDLTRT
jgi:nudix-type nucleoside diphosphatase (YffH/AdpP family)